MYGSTPQFCTSVFYQYMMLPNRDLQNQPSPLAKTKSRRVREMAKAAQMAVISTTRTATKMK